MDARCAEDDAVSVLRLCIGDLGVEILPLRVELAEPPAIGGEWTRRSLDPSPRLVHVDLEMDGERTRRERVAYPLRAHSTSAELEHDSLSATEDVCRCLLLQPSELDLAARRE